MEERVQKILSQWGIASRRQAEEMIKLGRVRCNGAVVELGQKANPTQDTIEVDGKLLRSPHRPQPTYLLLNKPTGVVTTCDDPQGRPTVMQLLPTNLRQGQGIHPVGRLDAESTGALLLTNDGNLTFALTHPRHDISKTYQVVVAGHPPESVLKQWRQGVVLEGRKTRAAQVRVLSRDANRTWLEFVLWEGRNRQIRRMTEQLGYPTLQLHRTAIGSIQLESTVGAALPPGRYRPLEEREIHYLQNQLQNQLKSTTRVQV
ncbi:pseudouridine synthase [Scytonema millei]|uniref:Pseudouridine synthase n=1 Tax=Scytonema millei VB511283 TaxID=1245923 RepID=A0A9X5E112_9CYAN|nr:pseudouridine synthase [Scytonema millei]NHC33279.1 rRNA pseudouridine synthase [Scytonema millei VB511283]